MPNAHAGIVLFAAPLPKFDSSQSWRAVEEQQKRTVVRSWVIPKCRPVSSSRPRSSSSLSNESHTNTRFI